MWHPIKHYRTIHHHKMLVLRHCFRCGLYWQGLTHDLSKLSPVEFLAGAKYWQGTQSPNNVQRRVEGYSAAWLHHKGRNKHHYEYWTDLSLATRRYEPVEMPRRYLVEMVMDRRAACMTYEGKHYDPGSALRYFEKSRERLLMHPNTEKALGYLLTMLRDQGEEETFRYIRESVLKNKPFPWEETSGGRV